MVLPHASTINGVKAKNLAEESDVSTLFTPKFAAIAVAVFSITTFSLSAFAVNPQCYKKIEGISLDQSVEEITNTLQQLGLHDITCKQRSKMPCATQKKQMLTYATNDQGSLHKVGDKAAKLTFDKAGNPRTFSYRYYTEAPASLEAYDENRSWEGWTHKDTIKARINEYCKSTQPEGMKVGCRYGSALSIDVIIGDPRSKDCMYKFEAVYSAPRGKSQAPAAHQIRETITLVK
jgi:hypothetical protein